MRTTNWTVLALLGFAMLGRAAEPISVRDTDEFVEIETDALSARIAKLGYVSGTKAQSLLDKKTGARDPGFGLHIMDFLLAPGFRDDGYSRGDLYHGNLAKHYVEGPQICTQARKLTPEVIRGKDFVAVRLRYTFTQPGKGYKAGSTWEQTMVFQPGLRYMLSAEKITSVNAVDNLFYRIDMPGHVKHKDGDTFSQIYLSYLDQPIPASAFRESFPPDARFLYQRNEQRLPKQMIRAYQLKVKGKAGPWLAGITLDPAAVSEAWCHQRGYVCFIQELHRRNVKAGETFGAAYAVGYFDDLPAMRAVCAQYHGKRAIHVTADSFRLE